ncbi:hypothetical protein K493DRAFT_334939 [Basidiobolus meristosporus CBS 931.73]|uniref:Uncharacterized protein n=1 Tax=Basidiobolus meristosporus CBS 931.73 TaxID=1314790 RepID=A0A1Y1YUQ0_9FUNG|nr:hypothetical protein K493DRAFT_334939 [Basidiobolus meristosporus CBS 931.73]|eukprot:ORY01564.1 hypothetical protein K493DRAFT_334939 [Basidiobolus meristosporus CBS 931.73]
MSSFDPANFSPYSPSPDEQKRTHSFPYDQIPSSSYQQSTQNTFSPALDSRAEEGQVKVNRFETSLKFRIDLEAAFAYVLFCFSGVFLLITEQKNDYVRFHAWQSCLAFTPLFVLQFVLAFISTTLWWMLMILEIGLAGFMGYKAYMDSASLDRFLLPYVGILAANWVDNE